MAATAARAVTAPHCTSTAAWEALEVLVAPVDFGLAAAAPVEPEDEVVPDSSAIPVLRAQTAVLVATVALAAPEAPVGKAGHSSVAVAQAAKEESVAPAGQAAPAA
ncbi:hypothetical protein AWC16_18730 [Mycolicibacter longobardus]|uniref:Uncharacterized protein n=2 Tax=Mycolicibacter TaxID=1073531 RepID=A0A1X1YBF3_9MYCO|nr:hypothetical protein AWC16_18730 [Mycolicibacter longobardus]